MLAGFTLFSVGAYSEARNPDNTGSIADDRDSVPFLLRDLFVNKKLFELSVDTTVKIRIALLTSAHV